MPTSHRWYQEKEMKFKHVLELDALALSLLCAMTWEKLY